MVPRNAPNVILEAGRFQERLEGGTKTRFIDAFWHHLGSRIGQNDAQERSESDLGIKSVPGTVFWSTIGASGGAFCHHVVAAWVILGTILDRVSQNRAFWHQEASKVGKMTSRKGCWKKLYN